MRLFYSGWHYSGRKVKYGDDISILSYAKNEYRFAKIITELVAVAVKTGWVGGDRDILI